MIKNGTTLYELIELLKDKESDILIAPVEQQEEDKTYLEHLEGEKTDYVLITKNEYEDYLKFKEARTSKLLNKTIQEHIKARYKEIGSQRQLAKEFKVSLATINRVLNDRY